MVRLRRALVLSGFAAAAVAASGCPEEEVHVSPEIRTYVGEVTGTDAVVAVAVSQGELAVYVCGGATTYDRHTRWFLGTEPEPSVAVALTAGDGATATVTIDDGAASGTVTELDGTVLEFSAARAVEATHAGLYSVVDAGCRTGVVVTQPTPQSEPSVQGAWCNEQGIFAQVTPILPISIEGGAIDVEIVSTGPAVPSKRLKAARFDPAKPE